MDRLKELLQQKNPKIATVSGILTTKPGIIAWVDKNIPEVSVITTKSYQVKPTTGNREPIIVEEGIGNFGNAVGLRNPGMEKGHEELKKLRKQGLRALLNVSLSANSVEDYITLVKKFEDVADILELNFSCPHAEDGFGASIGSDPILVKKYVKNIRPHCSKPLFVKLTPNVENIGSIAKVAVEAGADGITAINTYAPKVFVDEFTRKPLLYNPRGHKGGRSGTWIHKVALDKVKEIRSAVGPDIPIIGVGGISDAKTARAMLEAGANIIGIGSAVARLERQDDIIHFFKNLNDDIFGGSVSTTDMLKDERIMRYDEVKIKDIKKLNDQLQIMGFDKDIEYAGGNFIFLCIPGLGEKPFAVVKGRPLTCLIRKKGYFTDKLFSLAPEDKLLYRGPYGPGIPYRGGGDVVIVTGGTGVALVPTMVRELNSDDKNVHVYHGIKDYDEKVFEELSEICNFHMIADEGKIGRVLDDLEKDISRFDPENTTFYNCGPLIFMKKAMDIQENHDFRAENIFSSLETQTMCGVGLCGECECGGKLLCKEGHFVSLKHLKKHDIDVMSLKPE